MPTRDEWVMDWEKVPRAEAGPLLLIEIKPGVSQKMTKRMAIQLGYLPPEPERQAGEKLAPQPQNKRRRGSRNKQTEGAK
ncbi:MAG TPA: hypothetical protein VM537_25395 [Anaerolineae bacterium]|nr:hypothetical protein [Anaerolineae bacterium]